MPSHFFWAIIKYKHQNRYCYNKGMVKKMLLVRGLIAIVLGWNLQCALVFILNPAGHMGGFGLEGLAGAQMVRAMGLLFVMWNVPYAFALADPVRNRVSLIEAVVMQTIGLAGEMLILLLGGPYPPVIEATLMRFILFDGVGLALLVITLWLVRGQAKQD
jgi:hypothetical protein